MKLKCFLLLIAAMWFSANAHSQDVSAYSKKCTPNLLLRLQNKNKQYPNRNFSKQENIYKLVCVNFNQLLSAHKEVGVVPSIRQINTEYQTYVLQINDSSLLQKILFLPSVIYADLYHAPKEELEVGNFDPSLNRINVIRQKFPLNDGTGLMTSVKENIWDTLDIDFKGRYISSGLASNISSNHATIMATLIGGGGNTSPGSLGIAPGVQLSSSSFANLFPDAATVLQQLNISIQNHSYGTVIENFYGAEARAYDQQLNLMPAMVHIFSAGNSGTATPATGLYSGLPGVANLTGNFKMAKNIITVSATDSFSRVPSPISKGPAYDGRLHPEITAFAEDGSSGAAAIVSGTAVMLQHLYRQHYGTLPAAALLRAVLYNSADDIGTTGIDFASGYGSLNAKSAAENIVNGRFFSGTVAQGGTQSFPVTIPAGIQTAKFTLVWNDPANAVLAAKALVNDLDISVVRLSDNFRYLPWVLNHFPHADSLQQLPQRKKDTLNNAEQVTIDNPAAGNYEIRINGFSVPVGNQAYYIAYQFDSTAHFEFTHPVKNDQFLAGKPNTVRWQNTIAGSGTLQYSYNNLNWNNIATGINLSAGYYVWNAPDTMTTARLRMLTAAGNITGDTFVISTPPVVQTGFNCDDDFLIWWNKSKNTAIYSLYRLGSKYMEPFLLVTDTFASFGKTAQPALHYAVRPLLLNGVAAQRSLAYNYTTQGVSCYIKSFLAELSGNQVNIDLELGSFIGIQQIILEKQTANGYVTLQQWPNTGALLFFYTDPAPVTGQNVYRVRIVRTGGQTAYSDPATVYYFGKQLYLVYPNPVAANGSLHIVASALTTAEIVLYNMNGQVVFKRKTTQFDEQIPVVRLGGKGMYIYTIVQDGVVVQKGKLVIF